MYKITAFILLFFLLFTQQPVFATRITASPRGGGGGTGDITDVGDCSTGACFTNGGTGTLLYGEGNISIQVDDQVADYITFDLNPGGTPEPVLRVIGDSTLFLESDDTTSVSLLWNDDGVNFGQVFYNESSDFFAVGSTQAIRILPSNETDDYIYFDASANVPRMISTGSGNMTLLSDSGSMVFGGTTLTNNENLTWNYETTADDVDVSSATGVTEITFTSINLESSGEDPTLTLTDTTVGQDDWIMANFDGVLQIRNSTDGRTAFSGNGTGTVTVGANSAGTLINYSVPAGADHTFQVAGGTELDIAADIMTFNAGAVDPVLNWGTSGELALTTGTFDIRQDNGELEFGAGSDVHIEYTGTVWDFDVDAATTEIVFNNASFDTDFRIETNGITNTFFLDAGEDDVELGGHVETIGTAPTLSACGTTPSIVGNDMSGKVTIGSGAGVNSCTLTFNSTWDNAPPCVANNETSILLARAVSTTTTLTIDTSGSFEDDVISYHCFGRE